MAHITEWGEVVSSNLVIEEYSSMEKKADTQTYGEMRLIEGQIRKVVAIDDADDEQADPKFTTYEVDVLYPDGNSGILVNVRALQPFFGGGLNDFLEILPPDPGPFAEQDFVDRSLKPGNHVLIGFIGGSKGSPIILGALPHFGDRAIKTRPESSDGPGYLEGEFQGVNWKIDSDGAFSLKWTGPKDATTGISKALIAGADDGTQFTIDKNGNVELKTNADQSVAMDRQKKKITITSGDTEIELAQLGEKMTIKCKEIKITTDANCKFDISGDAEIKATGSVHVSSSSGIELQNGGSASEPFVLGNKFKSFMDELLSQNLAMANVIGNLGVPTPPLIQAPAISALAAKLQTLLSTHIKGI